MSDPNKIWAQGDELSLGARQLNMWTRGAQLAHQALGGGSSDPLASAPLFTPLRIRNATGEQIPRLGVVSYSTPTVLPEDDEHRFVHALTVDAVKPLTPLDRIAICLEPIAINGIGVGAVLGVVPCRITGVGDYCDAIPDDLEKLQAGISGYEVIWQESVEGSGERFAMVRLGIRSGCGNVWYFSAEGAPAGGTSEWDVTINGVTEVVEFPCPCTIAQTIAACETHSEVEPGDVTAIGGTMPSSSQKVTFRRQPSEISLLLNSLTRSWTAPPGYFWDPC